MSKQIIVFICFSLKQKLHFFSLGSAGETAVRTTLECGNKEVVSPQSQAPSKLVLEE